MRPFAVPSHSENCKYNLISGWFNKIPKIFLCVSTANSPPVRRTAVREACVESPEAIQHPANMVPRDLRGALNRASITQKTNEISKYFTISKYYFQETNIVVWAM